MTATTGVDFTKLNVVAVEDNAGGVAVIGLMMRRLGMTSFVDTTGLNAVGIALAMKPAPNIIFLDIHLPNTTGFEVLKQLRKQPKLDQTLIVAVTAMDPHSGIPRCKEAGFDGYISKPLSRRRFRQQIERLMLGKPVWDGR